MRLYELSKIINLSVKELIVTLAELGINVKSHMSNIDEDTVKKVRDYYSSKDNANHDTNNKTYLALELVDNRWRIIYTTESGLLLTDLKDNLNFGCLLVSKLSKEELAVREFEELLSDPKTREHDIHKFLSENPEILELLGYDDIRSEVCLPKTEYNEERRIDFMLRPIGETFYDILELKKPNINLYVNNRGIPGFASAVYRALDQARRYQDIINNNPLVREGLNKKSGINCELPRCVIFIGQSKNTISPIQTRREKIKLYLIRYLVMMN